MSRRTRHRRHQSNGQATAKAFTEGPRCITAAMFWVKTRGGWKEAGPRERVVQPRLIVSWKSSSDPTRIEKHELRPGPVMEHR
jgi:hypothetical protein